MKINVKILLVAFILAIFSVGAVAAAENVSIKSNDLNQLSLDESVSVSNPTVKKVETDDIQTSAAYKNLNAASSNTDEIINVTGSTQKESLKLSKNQNSLLGASNNENILGDTINFTGTTFQNLRDTISSSSAGDIIDLQGKTPTGINPKFYVDKNITIQNGVLDATGISTENSVYRDVTFKNISFINYVNSFSFTNCKFYDVRFDNIRSIGAVFVIRNSKLYRVNFTNCKSLMEADPDNYETGVVVVTYGSEYDHCNFINGSSKRHSGAICVGGEYNNIVNITNCNFINCSAGIGGAIYVHGNNATNSTYFSNIINCSFINNNASQYGGAVGSSQTYLNIQDCEFINNSAKKGAAIMVGGIDHGLDGNLEGHYNIINNCFFHNNTGTEEGGAVHITGNNNKAINCHFDDNFAHNGNGAAIYVKGQNASVVNSEFYYHDCQKGTVYIEGNYANVTNSTFKNNTASKGGAGVYIDGNQSVLSGNYFENNNATIHGGAIHTHGNGARISNSTFISNNAIPHNVDVTQGLGGAIFIRGDNNIIETSYFENNTARNGSAVYNSGKNLTFTDDFFHNNRAWSYLLLIVNEPKSPMYYNKTQGVIVNMTLIGGDNIINGIHNAESVDEVFFHNVTYYHSTVSGGENKRTTGANELHPVDGIENSAGGTLLYQDDREDLQVIDVVVKNDNTGEVILNTTGSYLRTGLFGNLTVKLNPVLAVGNYTVYANHPGDENYTAISNSTIFEIRSYVDVSVNKTSNKDVYVVGEEATFTIVVHNDINGSNATGVVLHEILPSSFVFVSASPTKGRYNSSTNVWTIGNMTNGESQTLILIAKTTALGRFNNVVNVTTYDDDWNLSNNVANKTINVDINYTKEANASVLAKGQLFEYYLIIYNRGNSLYNQTLRVRDVLPDGVNFTGVYNLTGAALISYTNNGDEQIWEITNITAGGSAVITLKAQAIKEGVWNNTMYVWDYPPANYTVNVTSNADLRLTKEVSNKTTKKGDLINWTITVTNDGPSDAKNVTVTDLLPAGLIFVSSNGNYDNATGIWTIGDLDNGKSVTLVITTKVDVSNANITNIAVVNSTTPDNNPDNNKDNDTTNVTPEADLGVVKTVSVSKAFKGDLINWTITVTNFGPDDAKNVIVTDLLPAGLIFVSSDGNYNSNSGVWTIGDLDNGKSVTLVITTKVDVSNANITNIAVVNSTTPDNNPDNNKDNDTTSVNSDADLGVVKTVSVSNPSKGDLINWTITVTNFGPDDAKNVTVTDLLPAGLIFVSCDGNYDNGTGIWTIGDLDNGKSVKLVITTKVDIDNGKITNIAVVNSTTPDYNPDNNKDNDTTSVNPKADVSVIKTVSESNPSKGDIVIWTITVTNLGPDDAENVYLKESLPNGLKLISVKESRGSYNNGIWKIGTLKNGQSETLTLATLVTISFGSIKNIAVASSSTYDPNKTNNVDDEVIYPKLGVENTADLQVIKTSNVKVVKKGDIIIWTITVINHGPNKASGVFVKDTIQKGKAKFVGVTVSKGQFNLNSNIWVIGDMEVGESVTLMITSVALTSGEITNYARVMSKTKDPNPQNNEAYATVKVIDNGTPKHPNNNVGHNPKTMHPAGNPILMVILALLLVVGVSLKRRY